MAKKYKTTFNDTQCVGIIRIIEKIIQEETSEDANTRLVLSALNEVVVMMRKKVAEGYKKEYKLSFTAVQSYAICELLVIYILPNCPLSSDLANKLLLVHNEILKFNFQ